MGRQRRTGMDDIERQAIHGDPEILEKKNQAKADCSTSCISWTCIIGFSVRVATLMTIYHLDAHYYVTIDSVSGLDDPAGGLSFNLTLGVGSWSYGYDACIKPGTYLEVSYHGFQLAASEAELGQLCAGPMKTAEQLVVATVTGMPVGQVLESLAAGMKQGDLVFDVTLHLPVGSYGRVEGSWVTECEGRRVGAEAEWCDAPFQMPMLHVATTLTQLTSVV